MNRTVEGIIINDRALNNTFTTSSGVQIGIRSVSQQLIAEVQLRAQQSVEVPPKPTYEVELPDESKMIYEHDEQSVTTEAEKAAWEKYQAALKHQSNVSGTKVVEFILARGTTVDMADDWQETQEFFGIQLPTHPIKLKLHYLMTEALSKPDDLTGLMAAIFDASGIDKTILEAAKNSFRGQLRQEPDATSGTSGEVQPTQAGGEVAHLAALPRTGDGEIVGVNSLEMG